MREDFRSALEKDVGAQSLSEGGRPGDPTYLEKEPYVPSDAKVLCSLSGGMLLLLDTGILQLEVKGMFMSKGRRFSAELIPFGHLGKVSVKQDGAVYVVEVHKHESHSGVIAGSSAIRKLQGLTLNRDNAFKFQELLLSIIAGPGKNPQSSESSLDKIGQLKHLLDSGAITQAEFDEKKKKLMDSI